MTSSDWLKIVVFRRDFDENLSEFRENQKNCLRLVKIYRVLRKIGKNLIPEIFREKGVADGVGDADGVADGVADDDGEPRAPLDLLKPKCDVLKSCADLLEQVLMSDVVPADLTTMRNYQL